MGCQGVNRLPILRHEFGFKGVKTIEIVEPPTVGAEPGEDATDPERRGSTGHAGAGGKRRESERDIAGVE